MGVYNQVKVYQKKLKGFYKDLGTFKMTTQFEKDNFFVGDTANFIVNIDNSECLSDVKNINCSLIQYSNYSNSKNS